MSDSDVILQQQKVADELLDKISIAYPEVALLGGAPRNWYYNRPAKDLDFYISSYSLGSVVDRLGRLGIGLTNKLPEEQPASTSLRLGLDNGSSIAFVSAARWSVAEELNSRWREQTDDVLGNSNDPYSSNPNIASVYEGVYEGQTIQVIVSRVPPNSQFATAVLRGFPNSICKIQYSPGAVYKKLEEFVIADTAEVILYSHPGTHPLSHRFNAKIAEYFPERAWVRGWKELSLYLVAKLKNQHESSCSVYKTPCCS